ncbi:hypothetical protein ACFQ5O_04470 [Lacticaseibacillus jixianensis]
MKITYQQITQVSEAALRLLNEPFARLGRLVVTRDCASRKEVCI